MKIASILFYIIGSILLVVSCFTQSIPLTWWLGGSAVATLIIGCVLQFNSNKQHAFSYRHAPIERNF